LQVIKGAGHHVYADKAYQFNNVVMRICQIVDNRMDFGQPFIPSARRRLRISESSSPDNAPPLKKDIRRHHSESMPTFSKIHADTDNWERAYRAPTDNDKVGQSTSTQSETDEEDGEVSTHTPSKVAFSVGSEDIIKEENEL